MSTPLKMQTDAIRSKRAREHHLKDHFTRTAEVRQLQAEAIANGLHWVRTNFWRGLKRLIDRESRRRRIAIAQLKSLDDRLLADIGLTRGQIELAVDGVLARRGRPLLRLVDRRASAGDAPDELRLAA